MRDVILSVLYDRPGGIRASHIASIILYNRIGVGIADEPLLLREEEVESVLDTLPYLFRIESFYYFM